MWSRPWLLTLGAARDLVEHGAAKGGQFFLNIIFNDKLSEPIQESEGLEIEAMVVDTEEKDRLMFPYFSSRKLQWRREERGRAAFQSLAPSLVFYCTAVLFI